MILDMSGIVALNQFYIVETFKWNKGLLHSSVSGTEHSSNTGRYAVSDGTSLLVAMRYYVNLSDAMIIDKYWVVNKDGYGGSWTILEKRDMDLELLLYLEV